MRTFLLAFIFLICFSLTGQNTSSQLYLPDSNYVVTKSKQRNNKAYNDTLWTEDFNGGLPSGWSISTNSFGNLNWRWDTVYRSGMFTSNTPAINSSTAFNGFMSMPLDFYNTPMPAIGAVNYTSYFQSPPIPISNRASIELRLQQYYQLCCSSNSDAVVQVSNDNFQTFDEYNLSTVILNTPSANVEFASINVSKTLAYQDTAYLRFYIDGFSHYFWMIDDLALVEGNGQKIEKAEFYTPTLAKGPFPLISPLHYLNDVGFQANVKNTTGDTITGVNLGIEVNHVKHGNGAAGFGLVKTANQLANNGGLIAAQQTDTVQVSASASLFTPNWLGEYQADLWVNSFEYPSADSAELHFTISDTVFGRDFNSPSGIVGTVRYTTNIPPNGDRVGYLYYVDSSQFNVQFSSVSFYVSNNVNNIGSVIRPVIWEFNSDTAKAVGIVNGFGRELASSLDSFFVTANDTGRWLTLRLDTGIAMRRNTNVGEFVVGWEMVGGSPLGYSFSVWNDYSAQIVAPDVSTFVSFGNSALLPNWGWIKAAPMIRLNVKPLLVGINQLDAVENNITISPNPSNGIYKIQGEIEIETFQVFDINGKQVQLKFNANNSTLDLSNEPSGIYFVRILRKGGGTLTKKLVKY